MCPFIEKQVITIEDGENKIIHSMLKDVRSFQKYAIAKKNSQLAQVFLFD